MAGGTSADGLRLALTTYTILPVRVGRVDRRTAGSAVLWSPLVGAALGGLGAAVVLAGRVVLHGGLGALLLSALAVVVVALATRGLHLDGLADTADGLGSHAPPERALAVMRQPDIGPFGVATLTLTLLVQVAALASCVADGRGAEGVVLAVVAGRLAVVRGATLATPAARAEGLGALVAGTVSRRSVGLVTAATLGCCALPLAVGEPVRAARLGCALVVALLAASALRRHAVRRLGGVTGDVYGALIETAAAVALVVLAAWPPGAGTA